MRQGTAQAMGYLYCYPYLFGAIISRLICERHPRLLKSKSDAVIARCLMLTPSLDEKNVKDGHRHEIGIQTTAVDEESDLLQPKGNDRNECSHMFGKLPARKPNCAVSLPRDGLRKLAPVAHLKS